MSTCPHTGISVPECSCVRCIERQLSRFAPGALTAHRIVHDPLLLREVRPAVGLPPPVAERLHRPAL
jgi:hypothetical protein